LKNLIIRTITGGFFVAAIIFGAIWSPQLFAIIFLLVTMAGMWEFQRLVNPDLRFIDIIPFLLHGLIIYSIITLYSLTILEAKFLWLILPVIVLQSSIQVIATKKDPLVRITSDISGFAFVLIPLAILNIYLNPAIIPGYHTAWFVLGMFVILWTHDTFAYLTGSFFGKHPLFKAISPKKTWEGSIGGLGFALIAAYIISIFSPELESWHWFLIALIIAVFGTIGDLAESLLKRRAGVKDSGKLLPGHGGILDRFDSVLFVSPIILVIILLFSI
jgi:phosphatidate cytidylyltransferase